MSQDTIIPNASARKLGTRITASSLTVDCAARNSDLNPALVTYMGDLASNPLLQLVNLIYEAALEAELWPKVVENLCEAEGWS